MARRLRSLPCPPSPHAIPRFTTRPTAANDQHHAVIDRLRRTKALNTFPNQEDREANQHQRIYECSEHACTLIAECFNLIAGARFQFVGRSREHQAERIREIMARVGKQRETAGPPARDGFGNHEQQRHDQRRSQDLTRRGGVMVAVRMTVMVMMAHLLFHRIPRIHNANAAAGKLVHIFRRQNRAAASDVIAASIAFAGSMGAPIILRFSKICG